MTDLRPLPGACGPCSSRCTSSATLPLRRRAPSSRRACADSGAATSPDGRRRSAGRRSARDRRILLLRARHGHQGAARRLGTGQPGRGDQVREAGAVAARTRLLGLTDGEPVPGPISVSRRPAGRRGRARRHRRPHARRLERGACRVPAEPLARLWHAATVLREHRGDGHIAALVAADIDGLQRRSPCGRAHPWPQTAGTATRRRSSVRRPARGACRCSPPVAGPTMSGMRLPAGCSDAACSRARRRGHCGRQGAAPEHRGSRPTRLLRGRGRDCQAPGPMSSPTCCCRSPARARPCCRSRTRWEYPPRRQLNPTPSLPPGDLADEHHSSVRRWLTWPIQPSCPTPIRYSRACGRPRRSRTSTAPSWSSAGMPTARQCCVIQGPAASGTSPWSRRPDAAAHSGAAVVPVA